MTLRFSAIGLEERNGEPTAGGVPMLARKSEHHEVRPITKLTKPKGTMATGLGGWVRLAKTGPVA